MEQAAKRYLLNPLRATVSVWVQL